MKPLLIGTKTKWGIVKAVLYTMGERYYMMLKGQCSCSLMPADVVESRRPQSPEVEP